jgi:hypothetical protein
MIEMYAPCLLENRQPKQTIAEELEVLRETNPLAYERRIKYAHDLLLKCGRDPITGDALPHFDQATASAVLTKALNIQPESEVVVEPVQILQSTTTLAQTVEETSMAAEIHMLEVCEEKLSKGEPLTNEEKLKLSVSLAGHGEVLTFEEKMKLAIPIGPRSDYVYPVEEEVYFCLGDEDPFGDRS